MTTTWPMRSSGRLFAWATPGTASSARPSTAGRRNLRMDYLLPRGPDRTLPGVPEGDTIHYAANRIRPVLAGHVPDSLETPHPRFGRDRWPERLPRPAGAVGGAPRQ